MFCLHTGDQTADVMKPISKWAQTVYETRRLPYYMAMAFREAMTGRFGPAFLQVPSDVLFGRVDEDTIEYFRGLSEQSGIPYQSLINLYLRDCAAEKKRLKLKWAS